MFVDHDNIGQSLDMQVKWHNDEKWTTGTMEKIILHLSQMIGPRHDPDRTVNTGTDSHIRQATCMPLPVVLT